MPTSNGYVLDEQPSRFGELEAFPEFELRDRDALWRRLRRDGYLFLRGALESQAVLDFRRYYFEALASAGVIRLGSDPALGLAGTEIDRERMRHQLFGHVVPGETYRRFCSQPAIRDWYRWFLGEEVHLHRRKLIRHVAPGEHGVGTSTQAHYDLVYLREGTDRVLSSWIPLGECPVSRGGLTYLESSHHRVLEAEADGSLRPTGAITADLPALAEEYDTRWLVADYRPGDMVVHTAYTVHAALDNVDPGGVLRLSTDIRYQRTDQPIDLRWSNDWHDRDQL